MTEVNFGAARLEAAARHIKFQRDWVRLFELIELVENAHGDDKIGDEAKRKYCQSALKEALDLEYDLTGDCVAVSPIADAYGVAETKGT